MKFNAVLIDIDDTLFDFRQSSFEALQKTFREVMDRDFTWEDMPRYEACNNTMWQAFERGEITQEDIYWGRFRMYFDREGIDGPIPEMNRSYRYYLAQGRHFMPHSEELVQGLHDRGVKIFAVTNGNTYAQESRIDRSGYAHLIDGVFISEQLGAPKPEKAFFDRVFAIIGEDYRRTALMVGDSLTSDMQGGRNAGIPTCLYGPREKADDRCDYVIGDLLDLLDLLENDAPYRV